LKPGDPAAVEQLFDEVAPRYDQLNDLLSFGLHRLWKRQLLHWLRPASGEIWLDLCSGTGDLALELARCVRPGGRVTALDASAAPLTLAAGRARRQPWLSLDLLQGDALDTGLPEASFDGVVMAYGLRNLADPARGLVEIRRLLKPGGRAGILDFNRVDSKGVAGRFQRFYLRRLVVPAAAAVGLEQHYAYLEASLKTFPDGPSQETLAMEAGFQEAVHRPLVAQQMGALLLKA
jgi:demethylmenaquinone methyltransferase/2-methoxy-6-polyprenyl-1,4-benzoquinol methylase